MRSAREVRAGGERWSAGHVVVARGLVLIYAELPRKKHGRIPLQQQPGDKSGGRARLLDLATSIMVLFRPAWPSPHAETAAMRGTPISPSARRTAFFGEELSGG